MIRAHIVILTALAMLIGALARDVIRYAFAQGGPSSCNVSTAAPSYNDGQTRALSCDTSGNLRVN